MKRFLCGLLWLMAWSPAVFGQTTPRNPVETHHYNIEVAGIRVGTLTVSRQTQTDGQTLYTQISDVRVNLLVYKIIVYYKVDNWFRDGQLMLSTVRARTNRGNYLSRTEWQTDHYDIVVDQYKYSRRTTEPNRIDYAATNLFFEEPRNRKRAYSEYFGDYFQVSPVADQPGAYRARLNDREDEFIYENGLLTTVIKKNSLKNFIIRRIP